MQISSFIVGARPSFAFSAGAFTPFFIILGILAVGVLYIAYSVFVNSKISVKEQEVEEMLQEIAQKDTNWNESELKELAEEAFYKVRAAVLEKNMNELKKMLHPSLYTKWIEQVQALEIGPEQRSESLSVEQVEIVDLKNYKDNEKDAFTASIEFDGPEYTVHRTGKLKMIFKGENSQDEEVVLLTEYWTFEREGDIWALVNVDRQGNWRKFAESEAVNEE